ncbi:L-cysteine desulfhydrase [Hondaea fermentalgiana]|uniref:L-cysteine desulfhydrase n=1 Tax=Hondaea fermentalgiana TaxID=2315210 RepID=A0A2R5G052_9STRA|nr:L-cysteine desulfhydrase [Hondaea fermentalgiana]|eukprot:GBG24406.1 L-cysteine desulfhydrase [Hondaea fermentalgiana]
MKTAGFRGFGSFMVAESIEDMVARACRGERVAKLPFASSALSRESTGVKVSPLKRTSHEDFALDLAEFTFVNHGAFGAALRAGSRRAREWREYAEEQPLRYFDRDLFPGLVESARRLASFIGARPDQLALTNNATAGLDAVIASAFAASDKCNDRILIFDTTYGSVKKMAARHFGSDHVDELHLPLPLRDQDHFLYELEAQLDSMDLTNTRLAVVDHVTSNTAVCLPIEEMSKLFQARGIPTLVDGAHGPWATALDLEALSCDYYVGNCHKWLCAPKSVGFVFVRSPDEHTASLAPRITSHGEQSPFPGCFFWDGCRDYAAALALPAVLDYWYEHDAILARSQAVSLVQEARAMLEKRWATENLGLAAMGSEFTEIPMTCVGLPVNLEHGSSADAHGLQERLYHTHKVECPVKEINGRLYLRISSHVYNCLDDYERVAHAVDDVLRDVV